MITPPIPIKTVSEANQSEHWATKMNRKKSQQHDFVLLWRQLKIKVNLPATIAFTRHSCKLMDADNLAGAFKHVQDALARELGVDDGDGQVQWFYTQKQTKKREHYITLTSPNFESK